MSSSSETRRKPRQILGMNNLAQVDIRLNNSNNSSKITNSNSSNINSNSSNNIPKNSNSNSSNQNLNNPESLCSQNSINNMDRLNLGSLIAQADSQSQFSPYGQFLSPVCPQPALTMFQSPPLPYQLPAYQSNIASNYDNNLQSRVMPNMTSNSQTRKNESSNNMFIQIGLQCVNQNNPININSLNDLSVPVMKTLQDQPDNCLMSLNPKVPSNGTINNFIDRNNFDSSFTKDYDKKVFNNRFLLDDPRMCANNNEQDIISQDKFAELTRLAMRGSELAERLAYTHRNRPCFKKIDSLCARMKQDLIRPDGVLPNINSQGIAWAVKDFIFVFTRVINAWIIIKGYVYNTPEGLNKVKSALSPDFIKSFAAWQDTTMDFVENLIKSFVNLDHLVQCQKASFQKVDNIMKGNGNNSTPAKSSSTLGGNTDLNNLSSGKFNNFDDTFDILNSSTETYMSKLFPSNENCTNLNKSYFSTLVEDSEESQRKATANGTYFKTGVYNPLQKDTSDLDGKKDLVEPIFEQAINNKAAAYQNLCNNEMEMLWPNPLLATTATNIYNTPINGEGDGKQRIPAAVEFHDKRNDWLHCNVRVLETNLSRFSSPFNPTISKPINAELREKLDVLLQRISNLSEGKYFFNSNFTRNYFPDFSAQYPNFMDLRSIILKAQVGGYSHLFEVIHDLKLVVHFAKGYLMSNRDERLKSSINEYEKEINDILKDKIFQNYRFDHITGNPKENIYGINNNNLASTAATK